MTGRSVCLMSAGQGGFEPVNDDEYEGGTHIAKDTKIDGRTIGERAFDEHPELRAIADATAEMQDGTEDDWEYFYTLDCLAGRLNRLKVTDANREQIAAMKKQLKKTELSRADRKERARTAMSVINNKTSSTDRAPNNQTRGQYAMQCIQGENR